MLSLNTIGDGKVYNELPKKIKIVVDELRYELLENYGYLESPLYCFKTYEDRVLVANVKRDYKRFERKALRARSFKEFLLLLKPMKKYLLKDSKLDMFIETLEVDNSLTGKQEGKKLFLHENENVNMKINFLNLVESNYANLTYSNKINELSSSEGIEYIILPYKFKMSCIKTILDMMTLFERLDKNKIYLAYYYDSYEDYLFFYTMAEKIGIKFGIVIREFRKIYMFENEKEADFILIDLDDKMKKIDTYDDFLTKILTNIKEAKSIFTKNKINYMIKINELTRDDIIDKLLNSGFKKLYFSKESYEKVCERVKEYKLRRIKTYKNT